ncbi:MAG: hypothetical protein ISS63_01020 [Desulfobacteraceae bacterium]|nr:hypothetical protein [Desulfobacteraceae bacterium]
MAESSIPGLFAAGEVAAGPHGADRIGGCMMTATQVFGARAGKFAAERAKKTKKIPETKGIPGILRIKKRPDYNKGHLLRMQDSARSIYNDNLMILRDKKGLLQALESIRELQLEVDEAPRNGHGNLTGYLELRTVLLLGKLIGENALDRGESLGSHFRIDSVAESNYHPQRR